MSRRLCLAALVAFVAACGPQPQPQPTLGSEHRGDPRHHRHHEHHDAGADAGAPEAGHHHHGDGPTVSHRFDDPEYWAKVFDDPARDAWQKPDELVRELGLGPTDVVADLGAGTGYFTMRLARAVPQGRVLAIEVEPKLVEHIAERAKKAGLTNIQPILGGADDPKLPDGVKVVLVVDTYHHIGSRSAYFERVKKRLAKDGRLVIVDWKKGQIPVGPPDAHKLAPEVVERELKSAGYALCRSPAILPHQYVLVFAEKC